MKKKIEFGISTFADVMPDPHTGVTISQAERIRQVVDDIVLSDELGVDFYGVGEHHRPEFAVSSPAIYYRNHLLGERGFPPYTRDEFDYACSAGQGLFVGGPEEVAVNGFVEEFP